VKKFLKTDDLAPRRPVLADTGPGVDRCLEGLALDVFNDTIRFGKSGDDEAGSHHGF